MVEGARLESVYTATYRGFESLSLRHNTKPRVNGVFLWGDKKGKEKSGGSANSPGRELARVPADTDVAAV